MKLHRAFSKNFLIGLGSILVAGIVLWRFGHSGVGILSDQIGGTPDVLTSLPKSSGATTGKQPRDLHRAASSDGALTTELHLAPFLRGLMSSLEAIQTEPDPLQREAKLESVANEVPANQLSLALEFIQLRTSSKEGRDLSVRLMRRWAENDSKSAADWANKSLTGSFRQEAMNSVVTVWANQRLPDAVKWARELPETDLRTGTLITIAYEAARTEPVEALRLASEVSADETRNDLISHTARQWAAHAPEEAVRWASQIADTGLRERVVASIASTWGEVDPFAAATLALNSLTPGRNQDDAVVSIVQQWAQKSPDEAAAWVIGFPAGTVQNTALTELVKLWADENLDQAGNWLNGLSSGLNRDVAIEAYAGKLAPQFPELAIRWAKDIADETLRQRGMETVAETWLASDALAAGQWITQSSLTEIVKARLLHLKAQ